MRAQPVEDRIVVIRDEPKKQTDGGLYIPDDAQKSTDMGVINAAGPDSTLKPGERIMFGKFAGYEFELNGVVLILLRNDEVLAKIEGE